MKAEIIRFKQIKSLINEEFNFYGNKKMNSDFHAYFRSVANKKSRSWMLAYFYFQKFVKNKCTFNNLSIELCENYRKYLLNSFQIKHPSFKIKRNIAAGYFSTFRTLLKMAYKEKIMRKDMNLYLDTINREETKKEILIPEEIIELIKTLCEIPVLKSALLFSCMTGLCLGDILELTWSDIRQSSEGGYCIRI